MPQYRIEIIHAYTVEADSEEEAIQMFDDEDLIDDQPDETYLGDVDRLD